MNFTVKSERGRTEYTAFALSKKECKKNVLCADESRGIECADGALRCGVGVETYLLSGAGVALDDGAVLPEKFFVRLENTEGECRETLGYVGADGKAYLLDEETGEWAVLAEVGARATPLTAFCTDGSAKTFFFGENGARVYNGETSVEKLSVECVSEAACAFRGRIFFVGDAFALNYSAPLEPTDLKESINDGGRIVFPTERGKIVAMAPLSGKLYIFREYGIAELEVCATASAFVYRELAYHGGKIFRGGVGVCAVKGEKAYFLAEDGVYAFDGSEAYRVCKNVDVLPKSSDQVCDYAVFDGKYFLQFTDVNGDRRGLVVDGETGEGYYAFYAMGVSSVGGGAFCAVDGEVKRLRLRASLPEGERRIFEAKRVELGFEGVKTLTALELSGEGDCNLTVGNGKRKKTFALRLDDGRARVRVGLRGRAFSLKLELADGGTVFGLNAEWERLARSR